METLKAIIVDDEEHCTLSLTINLKRHCPQVQIIGTANNGQQALEILSYLKPQIIFLDINMPHINGLQLAQKLHKSNYKIIFTTAYHQHAIAAIKLSAIDYLLKPIDPLELKETIDKILNNNFEATSSKQLQEFEGNKTQKITNTVAVSTFKGLIFLKLNEILYFEADGCYTNIIMLNAQKHLVSKTLLSFNYLLENDFSFFRPHKTYIINTQYIKEYIRGEGGDIIMDNGHSISLSRNKKQQFLNLFYK